MKEIEESFHFLRVLICFQVIIDSGSPPAPYGTEIEVGDDDNETNFEYSIKIVNPVRMSEFKSVRVCKWKYYRSLSKLRRFLCAKVPSIEVGGRKEGNNG